MTKEALYELEKIYPLYIEEIFEYATFRLKKLHEAKHKGEKTLKIRKRALKQRNARKDKRSLLKSATANLDSDEKDEIDLTEDKPGRSFLILNS